MPACCSSPVVRTTTFNDGDTNGLFTGTLLNVWRNGGFCTNRAFHEAILDLMPFTQTPNYSLAGTANPGFEDQNWIHCGGALDRRDRQQHKRRWADHLAQHSGSVQRGNGSDWRRRSPVNAGPGRFFVVEVATDSSLFDVTNHGNERSDDNFYGSWSDTSLMQGSSYNLPSQVWQRLGSADRLYYRAGFATHANDSNYQVSNGDTDGEFYLAVIQIYG